MTEEKQKKSQLITEVLDNLFFIMGFIGILIFITHWAFFYQCSKAYYINDTFLQNKFDIIIKNYDPDKENPDQKSGFHIVIGGGKSNE